MDGSFWGSPMRKALLALVLSISSAALATDFSTVRVRQTLFPPSYATEDLPNPCALNSEAIDTTTGEKKTCAQSSPAIWIPTSALLRGSEFPEACSADITNRAQMFMKNDGAVWACTANGTWTKQNPETDTNATNQSFSGAVVFNGATTAPGNVRSVDYTYPGEQPHWLGAVPPFSPKWIDIPIPSNQVTIRSLYFVVAEADWNFAICESKTAGGCKFSVLKGSSVGWAGDYGYSEQPIAYVDRDGTGHIHVRAQGADWFTFRALVNYTVN